MTALIEAGKPIMVAAEAMPEPFSRWSSPRKQGPITTGRHCLDNIGHERVSHHNRHGVWVPAFAGTTLMELLP